MGGYGFDDLVQEIEILKATPNDLEKISGESCLGLSTREMKLIQNYFKKEGRNPTDIELEALAQAWSEHCCYKTSKPFLRKTVFKVKAPQSINVISEDAGVVDFDKGHAYVVKIESHNHPSALDPYGGSATGIGGILRDIVCMGAQPIALVDPIMFGPLDLPERKLPKGVKHPSYLFRGVVKGISDYGNRVGIPTVAGQVSMHESYTANCIVNVGCLGIMEKGMMIHSRAGNVGDIYIMAGGKTGRDGIHGVTFASAELHEESDATARPAVQLGDAITKEPLIHASLEIVERGLATGLKDFGGGGLSCVASEMAHAAGFGAKINIDKVPLKVENMRPWEIWVSESQERMMFTCRKENVGKIMQVFSLWDVEATVVGEVTDTKRMEVFFKGKKIYDLDLEFQTSGIEYNRPYKFERKKRKDVSIKEPKDLNGVLMRILSSQNVCSKEWVIRQYDHEVRANTVLKPLQGVLFNEGPGDAAVLRPLQDSWRGLAVTSDVNPNLMQFDSYWGAASAVDECIRNLVAVGSRPHSFSDNLNFGNPEKPERVGDFKDVTEALYMVAKEFRCPYVSGNVSFYNEAHTGPIVPTPVIMGIGVIDDVRNATTIDLKESGNTLYVVGKTHNELGGSEYALLFGDEGGRVPRCNPQSLKKKSERIVKAIGSGLVRSCHDISNGGLATALAEMCFAGKLGAKVSLSEVPSEKMRDDFKLFSESNGRWILEVEERKRDKFESAMNGNEFETAKIGSVADSGALEIDKLINADIEKLREAWRATIPKLMGEK